MQISNTTPVIDSKALMERYAELVNKQMLYRNIAPDETGELSLIKDFIKQMERAGNSLQVLRNGVSIVHHQQFHNWAMEQLCETIPEIEKLPPVIKIDWKTSTEQFKADFYPVYYAGEMYWVRPYS